MVSGLQRYTYYHSCEQRATSMENQCFVRGLVRTGAGLVPDRCCVGRDFLDGR